MLGGCAVLSLSLATALAADEDVWGRAILEQPFDKGPFREVRVPEWLRDTLGAGYTLSVMSSEQRAKAAALGVTISELGFVDPLYVYYESELLSRRSPHVPPGKLEADIAEYHRLGVRVLAVYPPTLQGEVYEKHPEWRRVATNTAEVPSVDLTKHPHGGMLCLLGPYGDFFIEVLAEILTRFDVDAFSFDGLHYGGVCYCAHCREGFRKDTGKEIPVASLDDPAFRLYQHWADRRLEDCIRRLQARLKNIKPGLALVTWTTNAGRYGHLRDIPRNMPARMNLLLDAPDQEFWLDETHRGATVVPSFANAYIWALTNHRVAFSEPYLMSHGNPYGVDSFPGHEVERRMLLAVAHGVCPSIAVLQPPHLQPAIYRALGEVQRRGRWLTRKNPEPWAALVMSDNTRVFYGRSPGAVEERYLASVFGAFRAALEEHLEIAVIADWNLESADLAKYKVLVLPNTACLSDRQLEAVERFVEAGGGLVASLDASRFDELGNARSDFGLARILGVSFEGVPDGASGGEAGAASLDVNFAKTLAPQYWAKREGIFDLLRAPGTFLDSPRMAEYLGSEPVTFKGAAVEVDVLAESPGAKAVAWLRTREGGARAQVPAIVTSTFGKGRAVYLAAGFDSAYYLYPRIRTRGSSSCRRSSGRRRPRRRCRSRRRCASWRA
jgi:hypothetical protein